MTSEDLLEEAITSPRRVGELRSLALRLNSQGLTKDAILDLFERTRQKLRATGRETEEEAVTDVMDFLTGWCSPHMKLRFENPLLVPETEPGSSHKQLSKSTEEKHRLDYWLDRPYVSKDIRGSLQQADVVILPWEGFRTYKEPVFPNGTGELFGFLTEPSPTRLRVEIPVEESAYHEIALHAASVDLGQFLVSVRALPQFVDNLIKFINHRWPGSGLRGPKDTIAIVISIPEIDNGMTFSYTGPLDGLFESLRELPELVRSNHR